jgi:hypothetical protein
VRTLLVAKTARRASIVGCATLLALVLAACGNKSAHPTVADANNNGAYLYAGQVTYQLQISRELNPFNVEDHSYLAGVSSPPLRPDEEWYAVFLWAKNQTGSPQTTTDSFDIVDTQGNVYYPVPINAQRNPYAWTPQLLQPLGTQPTAGSTAYFGPIGGQLVLFKINISAYANRPLTLQIRAPGEARVSTISLDL